jgi:competence ComEA-like helix-hairpin-helix protein
MQMFRMVLSIAAAAFLLAAHTPAASAAQSKPDGRTSSAKPTGGKPLNINTASVAELDALPGIGAKTAALIVEYRQKNGPFKKIEEILESSRSCPYSLNAFCFDPSRPSPGVAKSLSKSRRDSRVVGALVGAHERSWRGPVWLSLAGRFGTEGSESPILSPRPRKINRNGLRSTVMVG